MHNLWHPLKGTVVCKNQITHNKRFLWVTVYPIASLMHCVGRMIHGSFHKHKKRGVQAPSKSGRFRATRDTGIHREFSQAEFGNKIIPSNTKEWLRGSHPMPLKLNLVLPLSETTPHHQHPTAAWSFWKDTLVDCKAPWWQGSFTFESYKLQLATARVKPGSP